jgi:hypothetical protein
MMNKHHSLPQRRPVPDCLYVFPGFLIDSPVGNVVDKGETRHQQFTRL